MQVEAGVANVELGTAVTPDTLFQIGSTTKVYTATLVMQLADEGLLDIDEPVARHLPDVRLARGDGWRMRDDPLVQRSAERISSPAAFDRRSG